VSTDYSFYCQTCNQLDEETFASGSISCGYKIWRDESLENVQKFLSEHEGHDVRLVSEHFELTPAPKKGGAG
jgi:hypothetical protein